LSTDKLKVEPFLAGSPWTSHSRTGFTDPRPELEHVSSTELEALMNEIIPLIIKQKSNKISNDIHSIFFLPI